MAVHIKKTPLKKDIPQAVAAVVVENSNKKKRAYKRIYDLSPTVQGVINSMLIQGKGVPALIDTLRTEYKLFKDITDNALSKYLYRYKWDVVDKSLVVAKTIGRMDEEAQAALAEAITELDVLKEITELVTVQKKRVNKLLLREKDMPMLFNSLGGEMKTLAGFLQQYSEHAFDIGLLKRVPKITKVSNGGEETIIESEGRESLELSIRNSPALEAAAEKFMAVLESATMDGPEDAQSL